MKHGMFTIFRKELARFFGDKRTALGTILLPGVLIFAVYTFMGSALSSQFSVDNHINQGAEYRDNQQKQSFEDAQAAGDLRKSS